MRKTGAVAKKTRDKPGKSLKMASRHPRHAHANTRPSDQLMNFFTRFLSDTSSSLDSLFTRLQAWAGQKLKGGTSQGQEKSYPFVNTFGVPLRIVMGDESSHFDLAPGESVTVTFRGKTTELMAEYFVDKDGHHSVVFWPDEGAYKVTSKKAGVASSLVL